MNRGRWSRHSVAAAALLAWPGASALRLDHVPIAVRNLPAAIARFQALGFTIKPGRFHANGIEHASLKFADESYVELITARDSSSGIGREYRELLREQEGAAYVFLRDSMRGAFTSRVLRAGGRREEAGLFAFTRMPATWSAARVQLIHYLAPADDSASTLRHANGARRVCAIWAIVERGGDSLGRALGAAPADLDGFAFERRESKAAALADGTYLMLTPRRPGDPPRSAAIALLVEVDSLPRGIEPRDSPAIRHGPVEWLPPSETHGVWLGFIEHAAWTAVQRELSDSAAPHRGERR